MHRIFFAVACLASAVWGYNPSSTAYHGSPNRVVSRPQLASKQRTSSVTMQKDFDQYQVGEEVDATVQRIVPFGVFCDIGAVDDVLLHISEAADGFVSPDELYELYEEGKQIKARIKEIDVARGRLGITVKGGDIKAKIPVSELVVGDEMQGTVKNVRDFGCFVDVGAATDGLLHISQASNDFVDNIYDLFEQGQEITVRVLSVDAGTGKFSLTRKDQDGSGGGGRSAEGKPLDQFQEGQEVEGTVRGITNFGVFVDIGATTNALLHISEASDEFVDDLSEMFTQGESITATIKEIDFGQSKIGLTRKTGGGGGYDDDEY